MLKRNRPVTISTQLKIVGQNAEPVEFGVTFRNDVDAKAFDETLNLYGEIEGKPAQNIVAACLMIITEWDAEYDLTEAGLLEANSDRPGILGAIINGYHQARRVELAKN